MTGTEVVLMIFDKLIEEEPLGFSRLRDEIGVNQATLAKHLRHLQERKYIIKEIDGKYRLGEQFLKYRLIHKTSESSHQSILDLVSTIGLSRSITTLYIDFSQNRMDCLGKYVPENGINMQYIGAARLDYLHNPWGIVFMEASLSQRSTSLDKLISSALPSSPLQETIPPFSAEEAESQLSELKRRGYVDDGGKIYRGTRRLAFPIRINGIITGALGCGFIEGSRDEATISDMAEYIIAEIKEGVEHE